MKKLLSFILMCLMVAAMSAQRCAVLEFKAGVGISQADVDGVSAIFITYFRPAGIAMVAWVTWGRTAAIGHLRRTVRMARGTCTSFRAE